ncbi:MAG: exo-alpha-sialidase [Lentisphaerae bacterium]|nr:exo-alpha-sialidase [Lentisphaerota bacterium]
MDTNRMWEDRIFGRRVAVSDTVSFTSSSAPIGCFDPDRGIVYAAYHASRDKYGEQVEVLALAAVPVAQPHRSENIVLLEHGVPKDGTAYSYPIDASTVFINGHVRVYFLAGGTDYYYVDYDPATRKESPVRRVFCSIGGKKAPLSDAAVDGYLSAHGFSGYNLNFDSKEHIINSSKPAYHNGVRYGALTSGYSQPIIFSTSDAETFEFRGIIPKIAKYEAQVAIAGGSMYALLRGAEGCNYYVSRDLGLTFEETPWRVPMSETRPQLMEYKGRVLMAYSLPGIKPNLMRDGRNNMRLLLGEGDDASKYGEIFFIQDKYGIVYYDLINYKNVLFMLWSNADLYLDKSLHGKDLLYFARIGEL